MSIESCVTFFQAVVSSDELKRQMKATTDIKEIIALGQSHGYTFSAHDLAAASTSLNPESTTLSQPRAQVATATKSVFYHYEFTMEQVPGFEAIAREVDNLKIKPASVNLQRYEQSFRADDLQFTSLSPAAPEFAARYHEVMQSQRPNAGEYEFSRRDFHLINLDQHVEHPLYMQYFQAKTRIIALLEAFFGSEIRFSGSMWYPPQAYRLWHTNETQPGWRMYLIDFDEPTGDDATGTSFFRYMNPENKEIVTLGERPKLVRFFKIEQEEDKLFWHCIVNATTRNRWSFGFAVPDGWQDKFPLHTL